MTWALIAALIGVAISPARMNDVAAASPELPGSFMNSDTSEVPEREILLPGPGSGPGGTSPVLRADNVASVMTAAAGVGPVASASSTTTALDLNFLGLGGTAEPSDGALAVGPAHVLEVVNARPGEANVAIFDKTAHLLRLQSMTDLLGIASTDMSDPRALYDTASGRWYLLSFGVDPATFQAKFYLAISRTGDPTAGFCQYSKDQSVKNGVSGQVFPDFPGLGMDDYALYVTTTRFSFLTNLPVDTQVEMLPRSGLACGAGQLQPFVWQESATLPDGQPVWEVQPAIAFGASGVGYFVGTSWHGGTYAAIWSISHSLTPTLTGSSIKVGSYTQQASSTQPGTTAQLSTSDTRVPSSPIYRGGSLWFAFGAQSSRSPFAAIRWYQLTVPALAIAQAGEIWNTTSSWTYPALMVDASGAMTIAAGFVGPQNYPNAAILTRLASDPPGIVGPSQGITPGTVSYTGSTNPARWGDYFGIALDPDGQHVWAEASYARTTTSWQTAVASVHPVAAGPVASSYRVTVSDQSPIAGAAVTVTAQALDSVGAPLALGGQSVNWSAQPLGNGTFAATTTVTNAQGAATTQFTTSKNAGVTYTVTASGAAGGSGTSAPFTTRPRPAPIASLYLPNVTKTLGGPSGFQTPFIVQNVGSASTDLELNFYRFSDGALVAQRLISGLLAGASYADVPNNDVDLPGDTQFSVVINSFGARIVSVVNQHKGTTEADAYSAVATGATTVYLPNVVRRFFGFHSPIIIQNLGQVPANVTATFVSFDGSAPSATVARAIAPGQSQFIEPNVEPSLVDGKQYSVTITSAQPVSVVLNTHNDDPGVALPVFYSANGIATGAPTVYGAYAVKNANGNRISTIVVQNLSAGPLTPSLTFTPLTSGGAPQTFTAAAPIAAGSAWAFDPRFINGVATTDQTKFCTVAAANCLGNGEYSFTAQGNGGNVAAMVNVIGPDSAMGYTASPTPATTYNLPNVLASYGGWTTPIYLQSVGASSATLTWKPFLGGNPVTQTVALTTGRAIRIDPNISVTQGLQYAVTVAASGGTVTAIVMELNASGGDNAMIYGGFPFP